MSELETLTEFCRRLGSPSAQAETMARQLLKRAEQLATERGLSREQALAHLLQLVAQGRQGQVPPDIVPPPPRSE